MSKLSIRDVRIALLENGFVPLPADGKAVFLKGWQKTTPGRVVVENWSRSRPGDLNTGIQTKRTPALDIDIMKAEAAGAVEALVRERFKGRGGVMVRVGRWPKRLIPFRTARPFPKIRMGLTAPDGTDHKLEFLGDGQQFIAHGIHPDTGKPYRWIGAAPWEAASSNLPRIDRKSAQRLMDDAAAMLAARFNFVIAQRNGGNGDHVPDNPFTRFGRECRGQPTIHDVIDQLRRIDPDCDYQTWFECGCAIYNVLGDAVGYLVFDKWSRHARPPKYDISKMSPIWQSIRLRSGYRYSFGTLVYYAHPKE